MFSFTGGKFGYRSTGKIPTSNQRNEYKDISSKFHCLQLCTFDNSCLSFSYTPLGGVCRITTYDISWEKVTLETDANSVVYSITT
jgi:hypothetical protein